MKIQALNTNNTPKILVQQKTMGVCCPHGNPGGSCPLCLGMGGGGGGSAAKSKPTAKELGLLTWADLLPAWNAMLAAKQRQEFNQKLDNMSAMKKFIEQSSIFKTINNFIDNNLVKLFNSTGLTPLAKTITRTMQAINNIFTELKTQLFQNITKLAGLLNEKLQQIMNKLKQATENFKNAMETFISNMKDKEKAVKEFLAAFANRLKKKLFRIVEPTDNSFEELEDQKNNAETYEELLNV
ncbi:MAG: hypothetical protein WCG23_05750 [bacterium]